MVEEGLKQRDRVLKGKVGRSKATDVGGKRERVMENGLGDAIGDANDQNRVDLGQMVSTPNKFVKSVIV